MVFSQLCKLFGGFFQFFLLFFWMICVLNANLLLFSILIFFTNINSYCSFCRNSSSVIIGMPSFSAFCTFEAPGFCPATTKAVLLLTDVCSFAPFCSTICSSSSRRPGVANVPVTIMLSPSSLDDSGAE